MKIQELTLGQKVTLKATDTYGSFPLHAIFCGYESNKARFSHTIGSREWVASYDDLTDTWSDGGGYAIELAAA